MLVFVDDRLGCERLQQRIKGVLIFFIIADDRLPVDRVIGVVLDDRQSRHLWVGLAMVI